MSRPRPARRRAARGASFLDYLIVALLVVLALIIVAGLVFILRGGL